jgi:aspartate racemase
MKMKTIGIVGGLGPESTLDYYREIIAAFKADHRKFEYPEILIYSMNLGEVLPLIDARNWPGLSEVLLKKIDALHRAGAEFAVIASNTPHIIFHDLQSRSPIPLLSIVEATCDKAKAMGVTRAGLMGTQFTMESTSYQDVFLPKGISVVVPSEKERQFIHQKLFSEIELGIFKDSTRQDLLAIAKSMFDRESIDSLILGCTELPLILSENVLGIPFLNTTAIHCERIVSYCLAD